MRILSRASAPLKFVTTLLSLINAEASTSDGPLVPEPPAPPPPPAGSLAKPVEISLAGSPVEPDIQRWPPPIRHVQCEWQRDFFVCSFRMDRGLPNAYAMGTSGRISRNEKVKQKADRKGSRKGRFEVGGNENDLLDTDDEDFDKSDETDEADGDENDEHENDDEDDDNDLSDVYESANEFVDELFDRLYMWLSDSEECESTDFFDEQSLRRLPFPVTRLSRVSEIPPELLNGLGGLEDADLFALFPTPRGYRLSPGPPEYSPFASPSSNDVNWPFDFSAPFQSYRSSYGNFGPYLRPFPGFDSGRELMDAMSPPSWHTARDSAFLCSSASPIQTDIASPSFPRRQSQPQSQFQSQSQSRSRNLEEDETEGTYPKVHNHGLLTWSPKPVRMYQTPQMDAPQTSARRRLADTSEIFSGLRKCRVQADCDSDFENCLNGQCVGFEPDVEDTRIIRCVDGYRCDLSSELAGYGITSDFQVIGVSPGERCGTTQPLPPKLSIFATTNRWRCDGGESGRYCTFSPGVGSRRNKTLSLEGFRLCGCPASDLDGNGVFCDDAADFYVPLAKLGVQECLTNAHCMHKTFAYCVNDHCAGFAGIAASAGMKAYQCLLNRQCNIQNLAMKTLNEGLKVVPIAAKMSCGAEQALDSTYYEESALPCVLDVNGDGLCDIHLGVAKAIGTNRLCGCSGKDLGGSGRACDEPADFDLDLGTLDVQECVVDRDCVSGVCVNTQCVSDTQNPYATHILPVNGSVAVPPVSEIQISFNENIRFTKGGNRRLLITTASGRTKFEIPVTDPTQSASAKTDAHRLKIQGRDLIVTPDLRMTTLPEGDYVVAFEGGIVEDLQGNGNIGATNFGFTVSSDSGCPFLGVTGFLVDSLNLNGIYRVSAPLNGKPRWTAISPSGGVASASASGGVGEKNIANAIFWRQATAKLDGRWVIGLNYDDSKFLAFADVVAEAVSEIRPPSGQWKRWKSGQWRNNPDVVVSCPPTRLSTPPRFVATQPMPGARGVDPENFELELSFDRPVTYGHWALITLHATDNSHELVFDPEDEKVRNHELFRDLENNKMILRPKEPLRAGTEYALQIETGAFTDLQYNPSPPITDRDLSFTTYGAACADILTDPQANLNARHFRLLYHSDADTVNPLANSLAKPESWSYASSNGASVDTVSRHGSRALLACNVNYSPRMSQQTQRKFSDRIYHSNEADYADSLARFNNTESDDYSISDGSHSSDGNDVDGSYTEASPKVEGKGLVSSVAICEDGQWDIVAMNCKADCAPYQTLGPQYQVSVHSLSNDDTQLDLDFDLQSALPWPSFADGAQMKVKCVDTSETEAGSSAGEITTCADGVWTPIPLRCGHTCGAFPSLGPAYKMLSGQDTGVKPGSYRTVTCGADASNSSSAKRASIICGDDAVWRVQSSESSSSPADPDSVYDSTDVTDPLNCHFDCKSLDAERLFVDFQLLPSMRPQSTKHGAIARFQCQAGTLPQINENILAPSLPPGSPSLKFWQQISDTLGYDVRDFDGVIGSNGGVGGSSGLAPKQIAPNADSVVYGCYEGRWEAAYPLYCDSTCPPFQTPGPGYDYTLVAGNGTLPGSTYALSCKVNAVSVPGFQPPSLPSSSIQGGGTAPLTGELAGNPLAANDGGYYSSDAVVCIKGAWTRLSHSTLCFGACPHPSIFFGSDYIVLDDAGIPLPLPGFSSSSPSSALSSSSPDLNGISFKHHGKPYQIECARGREALAASLTSNPSLNNVPTSQAAPLPTLFQKPSQLMACDDGLWLPTNSQEGSASGGTFAADSALRCVPFCPAFNELATSSRFILTPASSSSTSSPSSSSPSPSTSTASLAASMLSALRSIETGNGWGHGVRVRCADPLKAAYIHRSPVDGELTVAVRDDALVQCFNGVWTAAVPDTGSLSLSPSNSPILRWLEPLRPQNDPSSSSSSSLSSSLSSSPTPASSSPSRLLLKARGSTAEAVQAALSVAVPCGVGCERKSLEALLVSGNYRLTKPSTKSRVPKNVDHGYMVEIACERSVSRISGPANDRVVCADGQWSAPILYCARPSCYDGVMNNGETGLDCGGPCAAACASGAGTASRRRRLAASSPLLNLLGGTPFTNALLPSTLTPSSSNSTSPPNGERGCGSLATSDSSMLYTLETAAGAGRFLRPETDLPLPHGAAIHAHHRESFFMPLRAIQPYLPFICVDGSFVPRPLPGHSPILPDPSKPDPDSSEGTEGTEETEETEDDIDNDDDVKDDERTTNSTRSPKGSSARSPTRDSSSRPMSTFNSTTNSNSTSSSASSSGLGTRNSIRYLLAEQAVNCTDGYKGRGEWGVDCGGFCTGVCPSCFDRTLNGDELWVDCLDSDSLGSSAVASLSDAGCPRCQACSLAELKKFDNDNYDVHVITAPLSLASRENPAYNGGLAKLLPDNPFAASFAKQMSMRRVECSGSALQVMGSDPQADFVCLNGRWWPLSVATTAVNAASLVDISDFAAVPAFAIRCEAKHKAAIKDAVFNRFKPLTPDVTPISDRDYERMLLSGDTDNFSPLSTERGDSSWSDSGDSGDSLAPPCTDYVQRIVAELGSECGALLVGGGRKVAAFCNGVCFERLQTLVHADVDTGLADPWPTSPVCQRISALLKQMQTLICHKENKTELCFANAKTDLAQVHHWNVYLREDEVNSACAPSSCFRSNLAYFSTFWELTKYLTMNDSGDYSESSSGDNERSGSGSDASSYQRKLGARKLGALSLREVLKSSGDDDFGGVFFKHAADIQAAVVSNSERSSSLAEDVASHVARIHTGNQEDLEVKGSSGLEVKGRRLALIEPLVSNVDDLKFSEDMMELMCLKDREQNVCAPSLARLIDSLDAFALQGWTPKATHNDLAVAPLLLDCSNPCIHQILRQLGQQLSVRGTASGSPYQRFFGTVLKFYGRYFCQQGGQGDSCGTRFFGSLLQGARTTAFASPFSSVVRGALTQLSSDDDTDSALTTSSALKRELILQEVTRSCQCPLSSINDGVCDTECFNEACAFDGADCFFPVMFGDIFKRLNAALPVTDECHPLNPALDTCRKSCATKLQDVVLNEGCCFATGVEILQEVLDLELFSHPLLRSSASDLDSASGSNSDSPKRSMQLPSLSSLFGSDGSSSTNRLRALRSAISSEIEEGTGGLFSLDFYNEYKPDRSAAYAQELCGVFMDRTCGRGLGRSGIEISFDSSSLPFQLLYYMMPESLRIRGVELPFENLEEDPDTGEHFTSAVAQSLPYQRLALLLRKAVADHLALPLADIRALHLHPTLPASAASTAVSKQTSARPQTTTQREASGRKEASFPQTRLTITKAPTNVFVATNCVIVVDAGILNHEVRASLARSAEDRSLETALTAALTNWRTNLSPVLYQALATALNVTPTNGSANARRLAALDSAGDFSGSGPTGSDMDSSSAANTVHSATAMGDNGDDENEIASGFSAIDLSNLQVNELPIPPLFLSSSRSESRVRSGLSSSLGSSASSSSSSASDPASGLAGVFDLGDITPEPSGCNTAFLAQHSSYPSASAASSASPSTAIPFGHFDVAAGLLTGAPGNRLDIRCKAGTFPPAAFEDDFHWQSVVCANGRWVPAHVGEPLLSCHKKCLESPEQALAGGSGGGAGLGGLKRTMLLSGQGNREGSSRTGACQAGFQAANPTTTITCVNGEWSGVPLQCKRASMFEGACRNVPLDLLPTDFKYQMSATFSTSNLKWWSATCQRGYERAAGPEPLNFICLDNQNLHVFGSTPRTLLQLLNNNVNKPDVTPAETVELALRTFIADGTAGQRVARVDLARLMFATALPLIKPSSTSSSPSSAPSSSLALRCVPAKLIEPTLLVEKGIDDWTYIGLVAGIAFGVTGAFAAWGYYWQVKGRQKREIKKAKKLAAKAQQAKALFPDDRGFDRGYGEMGEEGYAAHEALLSQPTTQDGDGHSSSFPISSSQGPTLAFGLREQGPPNLHPTNDDAAANYRSQVGAAMGTGDTRGYETGLSETYTQTHIQTHTHPHPHTQAYGPPLRAGEAPLWREGREGPGGENGRRLSAPGLPAPYRETGAAGGVEEAPVRDANGRSRRHSISDMKARGSMSFYSDLELFAHNTPSNAASP